MSASASRPSTSTPASEPQPEIATPTPSVVVSSAKADDRPLLNSAQSWQLIKDLRWPKPQTKIANYDAARARFWSVYRTGGTELYCRFKFDSGMAKQPTKQPKALTVEHAYPADRIAEAFNFKDRNCGQSASAFTDAQCAAAVADLHNLWPANQSTNASRRDLRFTDLPGEANRNPLKVGCPDFERTYNKQGVEDFVDPAPDARGDIARSLIYMSEVYNLPLDGAISDRELLLAWHEQDPPDDEERSREVVIRRLQGTWNPLVLPAP